MNVGKVIKSPSRPESYQPMKSGKLKAGHQTPQDDEFKGCRHCPDASTCKSLCKAAQKFIQPNRRFHERDMPDHTIMFTCPERNCLRFSELEEAVFDENTDVVEKTSEALTLTTEAIKLKKYAVFIERFFNRREFPDIANQLNVTEAIARTYWLRAVADLETVVQVLDTRGHASKLVTKNGSNYQKFSRDEKAFLLTCVFGFSLTETASILGFCKDTIHVKVQSLEQKFRAAFESVE